MTNLSHADTSQRVLVLAPFGRDAPLLARVLTSAGMQSEVCMSVSDLCQQIASGVGAVLIAEEALADEGLRLVAQCVETQEPWSDLPIFVMTQSENPGRIRPEALNLLGNVTILERPLRGATLVSAFRMGLRARSHQYQLRSQLNAEVEAAQALRESERRYRTLAESMPQLVWTTDGQGVCDYLSRQWLDYTGLTEAQQLGYGWLNTVHPDDREMTRQAWTTAYKTGTHYDLEYRLRRRDGTYRWFKSLGVPARGNDNQVQKWFGSCTDIEEQKRVSEERRELLVREQKARGIAELLNRVGPMLLAELDPRKLAQNVTDLATQLTGSDSGALMYKADDIEGERYTAYALSGVAGDLERLPLPESLRHGTFVSKDILLDPALTCGDCSSDIRSYLGAPLVSRSGDHIGALLFGSRAVGAFQELHMTLAEGIAAQAAIALDNARLFSEAQLAQETLRKSNVELRRANEDLGQFAYSASHDLQEPLRMIALYSQMLDRQYRPLLDSTGTEYLNYMVQGAHRMEMLLRDLLDYTQVISGHDEKQEEVADTHSVLQAVVQNLKKVVEDSNAKIRFGSLPKLAIKPVHLLQLLQNLVGNALKYRGPSTPDITIAAQAEGDMWLLSVADNGIGIAPQYSKHVFGLFRRLHGSSQYEGTGIGLAICQRIVERYGGTIWVESEGEGKGCTFWFTLPGVLQSNT